ncbi:MAG: CRISPR-associated endonuclease Cas3'', partial [Candidatus Heimdallarchaeota archaeon]|nr:CRISPR-associated endonuclease Cas3'' [Candidatus Heimdallarchaeota archaeon]MCK4612887.1 CRISPR-associated endonuclease Cas3'' [Candidatus Heimdallarchaeota archaeon]
MSVNQSSSLFFLARPDQSLQMHIKNMLAEVIKFINKNKYIVHLNDPQKQKELLDVFYKTLVISHDFGKINPYFQRKIKGKILENKKLTYHSQIGGLLSIIILKMLEDCMGDDEVLKETRVHLTAITYAILNHHNRGILPNNPLVGIMKFGTEFRYKDLFKIIQEILEYSSTSRTSVDILIDYFTELKINNVLLEKVISLAIEKFLNISNDEEIEDYFYDFEERWNNVRSDNRLFHLILHYYSILCDLDEWDAKSHIENSENHMISFENDYYKIKGDIVSNYRVSEFKPIHEDTKDPLLKLKQKLWEEVNSVLENRITKNRIFSITYPTGSGKTISFLHLALM